MTVAAVLACWCIGSCILAPIVGRAIRFSRAGALRLRVSRSERQGFARVA